MIYTRLRKRQAIRLHSRPGVYAGPALKHNMGARSSKIGPNKNLFRSRQAGKRYRDGRPRGTRFKLELPRECRPAGEKERQTTVSFIVLILSCLVRSALDGEGELVRVSSRCIWRLVVVQRRRDASGGGDARGWGARPRPPPPRRRHRFDIEPRCNHGRQLCRRRQPAKRSRDCTTHRALLRRPALLATTPTNVRCRPGSL